jgi:hypothetical protein
MDKEEFSRLSRVYGVEAAQQYRADKRIEELEKLASQRGARMQIMRDWMVEQEAEGYVSVWHKFLRRRLYAEDWFDGDGVPVREET